MSAPKDIRERREIFGALYQANYHLIVGYVLRRTSSAEDAADVVAETFLTAWRRLPQVPSSEESRLWLYGVARRVLANHHRTLRRRSRLVDRLRDDLSSVPHASPSPSYGGLVEEVLARLREDDRDILGLVAWEGLTHAEIGTVLGCSTNAAKIRVHRARRRFAAELAVAGISVDSERSTGRLTEARTPIRADKEEAR